MGAIIVAVPALPFMGHNISDNFPLPQVLHGHGMLGREDGLYGAVSFAYQG